MNHCFTWLKRVKDGIGESNPTFLTAKGGAALTNLESWGHQDRAQ